MADNTTLGTTPSSAPAGLVIAGRSVTYSGDANAFLTPVGIVLFTGADDAKVATDISTANPFPIALVRNDVGSIVLTDNGFIASGQPNITPVLSMPYIYNGAAWVRGGLTPYHLRSAATTNATSLKASAGIVGVIHVTNNHATLARWLKFYNKVSAPNPAADTPVLSIGVPPNSPLGGTNIPIPIGGYAFSTGIAFAVVTGEADNDNNAVALGEVHVNLGWL